jgi:hypothetical protein
VNSDEEHSLVYLSARPLSDGTYSRSAQSIGPPTRMHRGQASHLPTFVRDTIRRRVESHSMGQSNDVQGRYKYCGSRYFEDRQAAGLTIRLERKMSNTNSM